MIDLDSIYVLKEYFGYESFRRGQQAVIDAVLAGDDALAIMPTGAGKSLCFQVPALMMDGVTVVVSPLISLMHDQVMQLVQNGVAAAYINSSLSFEQNRIALERAAAGAYKIIYVAPERLETDDFMYFARRADIAMVAVDEAHCVSHWGQDFRPSYLNIGKFVAGLGRRPVVSAFTATATDLVREDIMRLLGLQDPIVRATGFNRENLYFEVRKPRDKFSDVIAYLEAHPGQSGIIYCATRKSVDEVAAGLQQLGFPAASYHAGLPQHERLTVQQDFVFDRAPIMVATNAFGMGIDKSNVSFVLHYNMPKNIESYYQEAGRAGRDGSAADCILLYSRQDSQINQFLIDQVDEDNSLTDDELSAAKARDYRRLREMENYCNTTNCLRQYILDYFGDTDPCDCGNCGSCNSDTQVTDVTIDAQKILSCVSRMHGRFGLSVVIDVLKGANRKRLREAKLNELSTFGIMAGQPDELIRQVAQFLIQEGYMQVIGDRYPVVGVTQQARAVLKGETTITMPLAEILNEPTSSKAERRRLSSAKKLTAGIEADPQLLANLKDLRMKLATKEKVPAFMIFSDAALLDMCIKLPTNEDEFLTVSGVGKVKLEKYGAEFITEIAR